MRQLVTSAEENGSTGVTPSSFSLSLCFFILEKKRRKNPSDDDVRKREGEKKMCKNMKVPFLSHIILTRRVQRAVYVFSRPLKRCQKALRVECVVFGDSSVERNPRWLIWIPPINISYDFVSAMTMLKSMWLKTLIECTSSSIAHHCSSTCSDFNVISLVCISDRSNGSGRRMFV